jgi:hypothetical protein
MRGLDEQEREILAEAVGCGPDCPSDIELWLDIEPNRTTADRLEARGLVRFVACHNDKDIEHSVRTPLGQRILELDRIAREGELGL